MYFASSRLHFSVSIFKYTPVFITYGVNKFVVHFTVFVAEFTFIHVEANGLLLVIYNIFFNTSIIRTHL